MSRSVTKTQIVLIQTERNRMIPRFSLMRSGGWRSFVTDVDSNGPMPPKTPVQRTYQAASISAPPHPGRCLPGISTGAGGRGGACSSSRSRGFKGL